MGIKHNPVLTVAGKSGLIVAGSVESATTPFGAILIDILSING